MRTRAFRILILLLFLPLFSFAQNKKIDSLEAVLKTQGQDTTRVNTLHRLGEAILSKEPDKAMEYFDEALALSRKLDFRRGIIVAFTLRGAAMTVKGNHEEATRIMKAAIEEVEQMENKNVHELKSFSSLCIRLGFLYFNRGNVEEAIPVMKRSAQLGEEAGLPDVASEGYRGVGMAYSSLGEHKQAMENFLLAIGNAEKAKDDGQLGYAYIALGNSQMYQKDYGPALDSYTKALETLKRTNLQVGIAGCHICIGNVYFFQKDYGKAMESYKASLAIREKIGDQRGIAGVKENIGNLLFEDSLYHEALLYYREGLDLFTRLGDKAGEAATYSNLGKTYTQLNEYDKAEGYLLQALDTSRKYTFREWMRDAYEGLGELYFRMGRYKESSLYKDSLMVMKDSLLGDEKAAQAKELEAKFNNRKKEEEINYLNEINAEKDVVAAKQKQVIIAISIGLGLVVILLFFLVRVSTERRRANLRLEEQNKVIAEKNKDITDSITYARRIQQSVMPDERILQKTVAEYFIFNRPRDIVSGDFFWLAEKGSRTYIAVADCTGHGVPGALVSVIGINMLNKVVEQPGNPSPSEMLELLHALVISALNKDTAARDTNDGMDIGLLCIDRASGKALFSGAGRPMYYADNTGLHFIKGDRYSVAGEKKENDAPFSEQEVTLAPGMTFYLASDGFVDQFGENTGKKYLSKRFQELLASISALPMDVQAGRIEKEFVLWKGKLEQVDDVLVLGVRV